LFLLLHFSSAQVPILLSATLSALIWDFFFIPPPYTLHVDKAEDMLMLICSSSSHWPKRGAYFKGQETGKENQNT